MKWSLYIIECADGTLYTGITNDVEKRLKAHTEGKGAKYTRSRAPFKLLHTEEFKDRAKASVREAAIKAMPRAEKIKLFSD